MLNTAVPPFLWMLMIHPGEAVKKNEEEEILHYPVSKGRYTVKEEVEKAPDANHPCNLTVSAVKISFPAMKKETFVNFLGYREPNVVHLSRCRGRCGDEDVICLPLKTRERKVKMMMTSSLVGAKPLETLREFVLEEHLECGCGCGEEVKSRCKGQVDPVTCQCKCQEEKYQIRMCGHVESMFWDQETCQCTSRWPRVVSRETRNGMKETDQKLPCNSFPVIMRGGSSILDISSWILLGSCLALVVILALATWHYRLVAH